MVLYKMAPKNE